MGSFCMGMQDMHASSMDTRSLTERMCELQQAHTQQNERLQIMASDLACIPMLKATVRKQERVIKALEELLKRAVEEVKRRGNACVEATFNAPGLRPSASSAPKHAGVSADVEKMQAELREKLRVFQEDKAAFEANFEARVNQELSLRFAQEAGARAAQEAALLSAQDRASKATEGCAKQAEELRALRESEAAAVRRAAEAEVDADAAAKQADHALASAEAAEAQLLEVCGQFVSNQIVGCNGHACYDEGNS
jgi:hypothetical protein